LGLQSSAITFENHPKAILGSLSAASVALFAIGGLNAGLGSLYFAGLAGVAAHYAWQIKTLDIDSPARCWDLFCSNRYLGLALAIAIVLGKWQQKKDKKL
jgi:4-hydroxybenzoate polyprenyltransferase